MQVTTNKKQSAWILWASSLLFFVLGFQYPLLETGYAIGPLTLKHEFIYLASSFSYFFSQGEYFIGCLLLLFTIIFPVLKYIFLLLHLTGKQLPGHKRWQIVLEIINKWSMLDVFVVAVLILNLKFDSQFILSRLGQGVTLFAVSVLLLMTTSWLLRPQTHKPESGK